MTERFISVDVETDGPIPGDYSMIQIGASVVGHPEKCFQIKLRPISEKFDPEALAVSGLDRNELYATGAAPYEAMWQFSNWLSIVREDHWQKLVFVGNNAPFDWMFVCWYFHHFMGANPFGHAALDIRSYAMGSLGVDWSKSSLKQLAAPLKLEADLSHDGLDDARQQAACFERLVAERATRP